MMIITMTMMTSISVYGYKKAFAIVLIIISVSILMIIGVANAVYNTPIANPTLQNQRIYDQCASAHALHVKMFDSQTVPKYIVGKDYKITPVTPATTEVLINRCSLAAEGVSQ